MRRMTGHAAVLGLSLLLTGCFQHTFTLGTGAPEGEIVYKNWHHHWLFGLIRPEFQEGLLVADVCPSGNATIHDERTFLNGLVNVLIGIIYSPTTVTITCENKVQKTLDLSEEEVAAIVNDPLFLAVIADKVPHRLADSRAAHARLPRAPERFAVASTISAP